MSFLFQCEFSCFRFNTQSLSQVEEPSRPQGRWLLVNAKNGTVAMVIDMDAVDMDAILHGSTTDCTAASARSNDS